MYILTLMSAVPCLDEGADRSFVGAAPGEMVKTKKALSYETLTTRLENQYLCHEI